MTRLPQATGKEVIRALNKCGFFIMRQSGSHVMLRHKTDLARRCVVPVHGSKTIKTGTLHSILKGAGIPLDEFIKIL
jgi:predicted RNA binding protein YcfA (HicA-like mRNA interferase family)